MWYSSRTPSAVSPSGKAHSGPVDGAASVRGTPLGAALFTWIWPATPLPLRAVTVVATSTRRRTCSPTSIAFSPRAGTTSPWKSGGADGPWSVANERSTMASPGKGLNSISNSVRSRSVDPVARYQWSDAADAHGARELPDGPLTNCSTAPPPPLKSTRAATWGAWMWSASLTTARDMASIVNGTATGWPASGTSVSVAASGASVGLAMVTKPSATPLGAAVAPGQYQADVSD